jgi:hypothetical protein
MFRVPFKSALVATALAVCTLAADLSARAAEIAYSIWHRANFKMSDEAIRQRWGYTKIIATAAIAIAISGNPAHAKMAIGPCPPDYYTDCHHFPPNTSPPITPDQAPNAAGDLMPGALHSR